MKPNEHDIQKAFIDWINWKGEKLYPQLELSFAVPNGQLRHPAIGKKLREEGVKPGVPDWLCPVPKKLEPAALFTGLAIEFKTQMGALSKPQQRMIELFERYGWNVHVCRTTEQAIAAVEEYFG